MGLFDLIFPVKCLECGINGKYICSRCLFKVEQIKQQKTLNMERLISVWRYQGVVKKAILALKYKFALEIAKELADRFTESYRKYSLPIIDNAVLVPVPIHWQRQNWRGFNQSEEIGKMIAKNFGWGFASNLLIKTKSTVSQTELSRSERFLSPQGSFSLSSNYALRTLPSALILFDDVYTTGATLSEAAKVLQKTGTEKVWGLTLAR